jgi:two-component system chemotaxis response regulator CheB
MQDEDDTVTFDDGIVVIGASAGGIQPLATIIEGLPSSTTAAVFAAVHLAADVPSRLPEVVGRRASLPVAFAQDGPIVGGTVHLAPPGHHLLLIDDEMHLSDGPKQHGQRPAIDPLFDSAAERFSGHVVGVLVSGALDDGVAGLAHITRRGGHALVQAPGDAMHPSMPSQALARVPIDAALPADELARAIVERLARIRAMRAPIPSDSQHRTQDASAIDEMADRFAPTELTCPACGGAIWLLRDGEVPVLRCHVGHSYGPESFAAAQNEGTERALWQAVRMMEERQRLFRRMADDAGEEGRPRTATRLRDAAAELEEQARVVRAVVEALLGSDGALEPALTSAEPASGA